MEVNLSRLLIGEINVLTKVKLFILSAGLVMTACTTAQGLPQKPAIKASKAAASASATPVIWYDGDKQRTAWQDNSLIAEFGDTSNISSKSSLNDEEKTLMLKQANMRIWQVEEGSSPRLLAKAQSDAQATNTSPVFREGGVLKTLPGGVIVILNPALDSEQVKNWLIDNNLTVERQLNFSKYAYLINTAPGLPSLKLAKQLVEDDKLSLQYVQSATPNWWAQKSKR